MKLLIAILLTAAVTLSACVIERSVHLIVENDMPVDVKIVFAQTFQNGAKSEPAPLGTVPAGETARMPTGFIVGGMGLDRQVLLSAEDSSGKVIWQQTWTGEEFVRLKDAGWKIVVSPQTGSPP